MYIHNAPKGIPSAMPCIVEHEVGRVHPHGGRRNHYSNYRLCEASADGSGYESRTDRGRQFHVAVSEHQALAARRPHQIKRRR